MRKPPFNIVDAGSQLLFRTLRFVLAIGSTTLGVAWTGFTNPGGVVRLRATVDAVPWSGDSGLEGNGRLFLGDSILVVYATKVMADSSETVRLAIPGFSGPGHYPLHNTGNHQQGGSFEISVGDLRKAGWRLETFFADTGGTVIVTQLDRKAQTVSGTFSFTARAAPVFFDLKRDSTGKMDFSRDSAGRLSFSEVKGKKTVAISEGWFSGRYDIVPERFRREVRLGVPSGERSAQ